MGQEKEWLLSRALNDLKGRIKNKIGSLSEHPDEKVRSHNVRQFRVGLLEAWAGYLRTGHFRKKGGIKDAADLLEKAVKEFRAHYHEDTWQQVQRRMTDIVLRSTVD